MENLLFCSNCVMPNSKPDIWFDEHGICSACVAYYNRPLVDWPARFETLKSIVNEFRSDSGWDCIVPVSGGKDSTYQVLVALELGLKPLAVTASTCDLSEIGRRNLDNISSLGVDHVEVTTNRKIRSKLNRVMLQKVGDISWPEHISIFTVPVKMAVALNIPLIIWGENSQNEYGGPLESQDSFNLDRSWLEEFGGLLGSRLSDLVREGHLSSKEAEIFRYPTEEDLAKSKVTGIFLGQFIPWDGFQNFLVASANGWESLNVPPDGALLTYENLDNRQTVIHDYFKYLKYGFGRVTDHVCIQIRRGRLTRDQGLQIVRRLDGRYPHKCLDQSLNQVLARIDISREEFENICDKFTNPDIFLFSPSGCERRKDGSPLKQNELNWGRVDSGN
jgi:N-acetyl sugar amidotransferase